MKLETLMKIAEEHHLSKKDSLLFINFMSERFPNTNDKQYSSQWALRIKKGNAMTFADFESKKILRKYK